MTHGHSVRMSPSDCRRGELDQTITVEWTDQNGDRQKWSEPLPPTVSVAAQ